MSMWKSENGQNDAPKRKKVTIPVLNQKKLNGEPITMITGYDYPMAVIEEEVGIDIILVGDSLGMTVYGYDSTLPVTMDVMAIHSKAVRKAAPKAFVIGDMPYMSYQISVEQAVTNAGRLMQECGVDGVKLEGGVEMADKIKAITKAGIPAMGHLGLTPQSVSQLGGFKAQGRDAGNALKLIEDAKILEESGAFAILMEAIPSEIGKIITERANIPIISIGAGPHCDGQVLVVHDILGFFPGHKAKFVKQYAQIHEVIREALTEYKKDVEEGKFPSEEHDYPIDEDVLAEINAALEKKQ